MGTAFPRDWGWSVCLFLGYSSTLQRTCRRRGKRSGCVYYFKTFWHSSLLSQWLWNYFFSVSVSWACPLVWRGLAALSSFFVQQPSLAMKVNLPTYEIFISTNTQVSAVEFFQSHSVASKHLKYKVCEIQYFLTYLTKCCILKWALHPSSLCKKNKICVYSGHITDFFKIYFCIASRDVFCWIEFQ